MKLLIALILSACLVPFAVAERGQNKAPKIERLAEKLQLSDEQIIAVEEIFADHKQSRSELMDSTREEKQALRLAMRERLNGVLNEEQLTAFDQMREKRRGKRKGMRHDKKADSLERSQQ